jgi:chromate reductase
MGSSSSILIFAGSTRQNSYNKKLVKIAGQGARAAGASVTFIDLKDFPLPLYDEDLETTEGLPPQALQLKALLLSHQGLLIACPEYNSSISGVLKNAIDWASRPVEGEAPLACFKGKVCALMSASPGALGGLRGLIPVRSLLENIGVLVLPDQVAISKAHEAFNESGQLQNVKQQNSIEALGSNLAQMLQKLNA